MDNLVFSLNATVPIFLMMVLGLFFNKIGWMDEEFANKMNKFVFRIPLPVLLFGDLAVVDIKEAWDTKFVIFCFIITLISITIAILVMLGSATTVSSYVMAKNMGHEGVVSSSVVMLTTMCSAFTLTGWLFIMKCFGLV